MVVSIGTVLFFAGSVVPQGWVECNGQELLVSENEALFAALGRTYGGDGVSTFQLPQATFFVPSQIKCIICVGDGPEEP